MSLYALADHMASKGRNGDSILVHMTPGEVRGLQALALAHGGSLTINPETGLPEANFLKKLLPAIAGLALNTFVPGLGTAIGSALGTTAAVGTGLAVGGVTALATGSLSRGLMAGLGAYGGASLGEGLMGAGSDAAVLNSAGTLASGADAAAVADYANKAVAAREAFSAQPFMDRLGQGVSAAIDKPSAFMGSMGGGMKTLQAGYMAASPMLADQGVQTTTKMPESQGYLRPYVFDPYTQGLQALTPVSHKEAYGPPTGGKAGGLMKLANGGAVAFADGGDTSALFREIYGRDPADWELENVKGMSTDQVRNILTESAKNIAPPPPAAPVALPGNASQEALRARNPEMAEFMEWRLGEMDPMRHERIGALAEKYKWDPYAFSEDMYKSWQDTIENAKSRAAMGGETPEWMQEGWREKQAARNAAYDAEQERRRQEAGNSPFVTGGSAPAQEAATRTSAPAGIPSSVLAPITPPPAPTAQTQKAPAAGLDAIYNALADQIYGRKKEAWNTAQRSLEDWELAQIQGKSPEEVRQILQYSIDNWRKLHPEVIKTPEPVIDGGGVGPYTPPPNPVVTPPPPPPPPYVPPDPFDWQKTPITRLPEFGPIKPEDVMSGRSLEAYNALMGKGSTATKQWDQAPMRPYLPQTGNQYFIQRGDNVVDTKNPVTTTTPAPTTFTDPNQRPTAPPGPGMEWFWDSINKMWLQRPQEQVSGAKEGGIMRGYALGGLGSLGGYSDGGQLLKGPGDGVSDSIPATIGDRRPARLADGEFVVPARIVSELGNGSTDAGARKLYAMMDRVQRARGKTTGKGRVAANTRADKYLPA